MSSQSPPPRRRGTLLPSAKREGTRRSGEIAPEVLDRDAVIESEAERVHPETGWSEKEQADGSNRLMITTVTIVFTLVLLGSIGYFLWDNQGVQNSGDTPNAMEGDPALPEYSVGGFMKDASPKELRRSTRLAVEGFLNAFTLKERCQFIHGGERHLEKMQQYYSRPGESDQARGFSEISAESMESVEGVPFIYLHALDAQGEKHVFNLFPSSDGMLVDWESSVAYGGMTWEEFREKKPEEPVLMRVFLTPRYSEDKEGTPLDFVLLSERDDRSYRIVYVDPNGVVSRTLKEAFKTGGGSYPYTLYMSWNSDRRVAEVSGLKHLYWMDPSLFQ